ncbi:MULTISPECIES: hypothetical protein [unclassified Agarivorans]|uniref:hypothetical protein n=1 Tax=unclassified Agarivorans TaxID=2636026 RepID=UPI0026E3C5B1|nr:MULTISPECIES: hypothetical protein [unclassified Agarivorans]MDO6685268.1 hypothetical protein [Agarivorans sp. 3_MG-2023]MDO6715560.1 hypothetical protein [Agarivorans sp. 2_MG-2023]
MEKFISLSEVGSHSKLTETEVVRSANLAELEWACFIGKTKSILGVFFEEGFRGLGTYNYRGWVGIPAEHAVTIVDEKKVRLRFGRAIDITGAELLSAPIPYTVSFPNKLYREWGYPRELTEYPVIHIFPFFEQVLSETHDWVKGLDMIQNMLEKAAPAGYETEPFVSESLREKAEHTPEHVLKEHPFEFEYKDLGISLSSLAKLEAEIFGPADKELLTDVKYEEDKQRVYAIDEVLTRLFEAHSGKSSTKLWALLKADVNEELFSFDQNEFIQEIGDKFLVWSDASENERKLTRRSFDNKMSALRKKY